MDPSVADSDSREARMLAAIVFTDVVGFSKLAAKNEARVYVALQRDMAVMTNLCRSHGGQVLNTMGDGMLLCFGSAVDALGCAVEIQRTLFNQAQTLPDIEVLRHRIGVHLGDVIMNADNVFGDGVNVAARLQTLAAPGGICFSHTVHEVVKNKLKVDETYMGPRQLKNIGEPVKVWQIPPPGNIRTEQVDIGSVLPADNDPETAPGARGVKAGLMVLGSVLLVGLLAFGILHMKRMPKDMGPPANPRGVFAHSRSTPDTAGLPPDSPPSTSTTGSSVDTAAQVQDQIRDLRAKYRFSDLVGVLDQKGDLVPDEQKKRDVYKRLSDLESFMEKSISGASAANPIDVPRIDDLPQSPLPAKVYGQDGQVVIQTDSGQSTVTWDKLTPRQYLEIATAAVSNYPPGTAPIPDASGSVAQFATEFGTSVPS